MRTFIHTAIFMLVLLMVNFSALAEIPDINFEGIDWWLPMSDVKSELMNKGIASSTSFSMPMLSDIAKYSFSDTQIVNVKNGCFSTIINEVQNISLAGHTPSWMYIDSMPSLNSLGKPVEEYDHSLLYTIELVFSVYEKEEYSLAAKNAAEIVNYITDIYGEPTDLYQMSDSLIYYKWIDSNKNSIVVEYLHHELSDIRVIYSAYIVDEAEDLKAAIDSYGFLTPEPTETPAPTEAPRKKYLVNQNGIEIYLTDEYEIYGDDNYLSIGIAVENNTNRSISIGTESAAVNKWEVFGGRIGKVGAGKKKRTKAVVKLSDAGISTIAEIDTIDFVFEVDDGDTYEKLFTTKEVTLTFRH